MANVLSIENLTKSYGDRILFEDITLGVDEGEKIGIVARNGTGKSTFLSILAGREDADSGKITFAGGLRVAYLEQLPEFRPGATVLEAALEGEGPKAQAVREYIEAIDGGSADEQARASQRMDALHAWDYEDRLRQLLTRLGLSDFHASVDKLSGGQRKRLALARVVMQEADLIILDEPTNHLDIPVIEWLEAYLRRARATLLMVTHDRYFLDRVCNKILEIDNRTVYTYDGNYDYFLRRRAERIEAMAAELARVRNTLRREQEWMSRQPQARAGKAKFRIDSFYDLKERSRVRLDEKNVSLDTRASYIGSKIFEARGISKRFGPKVILDDFSYTFGRGEHLGLIGANGVGKSTFIKMLQGLVPQDAGEWNVGETVRFGYYSQDGIDFDPGKKVIDAVTEIAEDISLAEGEHIAPMQYLNRFLFSPADQQKYIHTLSGGERCRLHLATVLMRRPNFLILDEPTNDLDIMTLGILEEYLAEFKGCVLVISHDRFFLDSIADHLFVMEGGGVVKDFPGTYSEYRAWADDRDRLLAAEEAARRQSAAKEKPRPRTDRPQKMSFKERKEFEELTAAIDALTAEKKQLEDYFNAGGGDDIIEKSARFEAIKDELDMAELRWLELSEKQ